MSRVVVDRDRCLGTGNCEALASELFEVGDDGIVTVLRPLDGPADRALAEDAVQTCPTGALSLSD